MAERQAEQADILAQVPDNIRYTLAFLEKSIGDPRDGAWVAEASEIYLQRGLDKRVASIIGQSRTVAFVDGMKYALGLIETHQIRGTSLALLVGMGIPKARIVEILQKERKNP